jgi:hypothetical protein
MFYTYLYLREDGTPYYVGKGSGGRAFINSSRRVRVPTDKARILVQEFPTEQDALAAEIFLISYYGRKDIGTGCLRNLTAGGDGLSNPSLETRRKIGLANHLAQKGRKFSEERRKKLCGRKASMEHRRRISLSLFGNARGKGHTKGVPFKGTATHCWRGHERLVYANSRGNCKKCKNWKRDELRRIARDRITVA